MAFTPFVEGMTVNFPYDGLKAPVIVRHPVSITVGEDQDRCFFTVTATGQDLNYQWYVDSTDVVVHDDSSNGYFGAQFNILEVTNPDEFDGVGYYCVVSNNAGSVTSNTATITSV